MPIALTRHLINAAQRNPLPVAYRGRSLIVRPPASTLGPQRFDLEVAEGDEVLGYITLGEDSEFSVVSADDIDTEPVLVRTLDAVLVEIADRLEEGPR